MKTILKSTLLASLLVFGAANLYAGAGHSHDGSAVHNHEKITDSKALTIAKNMKNGLVKKGTIANSWESIDVLKIEKKMFGENEEWVVSFFNPHTEDKQSKHYMYL